MRGIVHLAVMGADRDALAPRAQRPSERLLDGPKVRAHGLDALEAVLLEGGIREIAADRGRHAARARRDGRENAGAERAGAASEHVAGELALSFRLQVEGRAGERSSESVRTGARQDPPALERGVEAGDAGAAHGEAT